MHDLYILWFDNKNDPNYSIISFHFRECYTRSVCIVDLHVFISVSVRSVNITCICIESLIIVAIVSYWVRSCKCNAKSSQNSKILEADGDALVC